MPGEISDEVRQFVATRAKHRCEYWVLHEDDAYSPHHVDHVIARKHGGLSSVDNLAYACLRCNLWKGTDVGSIDLETGKFVSLFNPREQDWTQHFELRGFVIEPLTARARVTARLLRFNIDKRVVERRALMLGGRYPRG